MKVLTTLSIIAVAGIAVTANSQVVNRGLPSANLNNASGANRSNVAWAYSYGNDGIEGDTFTMPTLGAGQHWVISDIRTWVVIGSSAYNGSTKTGTASDQTPGGEFLDTSLYLGAPMSNLTLAEHGNFTGDTTTDNANITISSATYADGSTYQSTSGSYLPMYQIDYGNLNLSAASGQSFAFGSIGTSSVNNGGYYGWFNHASNAALGGSQADGADGLIEEFYFNGNYVDTYNSLGNGWDKSSDINVQVFAQAVPEPSELGFIGFAGLSLLGAIRKRRA